MATFVEQATLLVKDDSTGQIERINKALKDLQATAKAFKGVKVAGRVDMKGLQQGIKILQQGKKEIEARQKASTRAAKQEARDQLMVQRATANAEKQQNRVLANRILDQKQARIAAAATAKESVKASKAISQKVPRFTPTQIGKMRDVVAGMQSVATKMPKGGVGFLTPGAIVKMQRAIKQLDAPMKNIQADMEKGFFTPRQVMRAQQGARAIQDAANAQTRAARMGATVPAIRQAAAMPWGGIPLPPPRPPRPPRGGGRPPSGGEGGIPGIPQFVTRITRGIVGGLVGGGFGESLTYAAGRGIGEKTVKGAITADIGEEALNLRQLSGERRKYADEMVKQIEEEQAARPGGLLFNKGQLAQLFAESLGVVREGGAYTTGGIPASQEAMRQAKFLTDQTSELSRMLFLMGKSFEESRDGAIKYAKAAEMANMVTDQAGKFDPDRAKKAFDFFRQLIPTIGEEATGRFMLLNTKYLQSSRFGLAQGDKQGLAVSAFLGEEMGTSAALGMHRLIKQATTEASILKGALPIGITKAAYAEQMKYGLRRDEMVTDREGRRMTAAQMWRESPLEAMEKILKPKLEARGVDVRDPTQVAKVMERLFSHGKAAEMATNLLLRLPELKSQWQDFQSRSGEVEAVRQATQFSIRAAAQGLTNQVESAFGQTLLAVVPQLTPTINTISTTMKDWAQLASEAGKGDQAAKELLQKKVATGVFGAAGGVAALGTMGALGTLAAPLGLATGMAALGTARTGGERTIVAAGIGLNTAAMGLQAAAAALTGAAAIQMGEKGAGFLKKLWDTGLLQTLGAAAPAIAVLGGIAVPELQHGGYEKLDEYQKLDAKEAALRLEKQQKLSEVVTAEARLKQLEKKGAIPPEDKRKITGTGRGADEMRAAQRVNNEQRRQLIEERDRLRQQLPQLREQLDRMVNDFQEFLDERARTDAAVKAQVEKEKAAKAAEQAEREKQAAVDSARTAPTAPATKPFIDALRQVPRKLPTPGTWPDGTPIAPPPPRAPWPKPGEEPKPILLPNLQQSLTEAMTEAASAASEPIKAAMSEGMTTALSSLSEMTTNFGSVFQTGATNLTTAGTTAGSSISEGGTSAASSISSAAESIAAAGVRAGEAIRSAVSGLSIPIAGGGVDTGKQGVTGNAPK